MPLEHNFLFYKTGPSVQTFIYQIMIYVCHIFSTLQALQQLICGCTPSKKKSKKNPESPMKNAWIFDSPKASYTFFGVICISLNSGTKRSRSVDPQFSYKLLFYLYLPHNKSFYCLTTWMDEITVQQLKMTNSFELVSTFNKTVMLRSFRVL